MTDRSISRPETGRRDPDGREVPAKRLVDEGLTIGYEAHGGIPPVEQPDARPERGLAIDAREEQVTDAATRHDATPDTGLATDDQRKDLPDAQPG